jgi:signal peptidase I
MIRKAKPAAFFAALAALLLIAAGCAHPGEGMRAFYAPSESMAPTFLTGDRFMARMGRPASLSRGDVVLVDAPMGGIYIVRVAGLPGDRVEMVGGIVHLNGRAVAQRFIRSDRVEPGPYGDAGNRLAEQFPGEAAPHQIYDSGRSPGDDVPLQVVPPGRLFLLGDNRDHSNDSRFSARSHGLEQVPIDHVRGVPQVYYWSSDRSRIGQPIR